MGLVCLGKEKSGWEGSKNRDRNRGVGFGPKIPYVTSHSDLSVEGL